MRTLITGPLGYVGGHVVSALLARGHEVTALVRAGGEPGARARFGDEVAVRSSTLSDAPATRRLVDEVRPDCVIHLAWYARPADYLSSRENVASMRDTIAFCTEVLAGGCPRTVVAGTCLEYAPATRPLVESDPAEPKSLYASAKHAAYLVLRALAAEHGRALAWARIFHMHGGGEPQERLIPRVVSALREGRTFDLSSGEQVRDHLHVTDVASGLVSLAQSDLCGVTNICSGVPVTLREVLEALADHFDRRELLRFGIHPPPPPEARHVCGESSRLRGIGWAPALSDLSASLRDSALSPP